MLWWILACKGEGEKKKCVLIITLLRKVAILQSSDEMCGYVQLVSYIKCNKESTEPMYYYLLLLSLYL